MMRKTLGILVVVLGLFVPVRAGKAEFDLEGDLRTLDGLLQGVSGAFRWDGVVGKLRAATAPGSEWIIISDSPGEGSGAGILNPTDNTVMMIACFPPNEDRDYNLRSIGMFWYGGDTASG